MLFIGVDLAWTENNESGVVALETTGRVRDAGWTCGCDETAEWIDSHAEADTLVFIDAPLIVTNPTGQGLCETHVGQRYWPAGVSANSTNSASPRRGGILLLCELEGRGFIYSDGIDGPPTGGRIVSECYPYTTLVGCELLDHPERPMYKRKPKRMPTAEFRPRRARDCDDLIARLAALAVADPPLDLRSDACTRALVDQPSPLDDRLYKHREDLLDAAVSAWTAALWCRRGFDACQVLGDGSGVKRPAATIIAPARRSQRASIALAVEPGVLDRSVCRLASAVYDGDSGDAP